MEKTPKNAKSISIPYKYTTGQKKKYKRTNNDLQNTHIKLEIE
jgi:hypothetical protein